MPPADVVDPVWIRYEGRTFLTKGQGPMNMLLKDMATYVKAGDAHWESWFGKDKSKWIFNTKCCATSTNYQHASCTAADSSSPSSSYNYPSPSPPHSGGHHRPRSPSPQWFWGGGQGGGSVSSTCQNAVSAACSGKSGSSCMDCAHTHHNTLIASCPGGRTDMRQACDHNIEVVHGRLRH